jgi:putative tryptophan/tyrosine transport system ATP-binding protein
VTEGDILNIEGLTVTFNRWGQTVTALDNLTLSITSGQWVMLVGHNGSGKSTLFKTISGQIRPTKGNVVVDHVRISELDTAGLSGRIFFVHQNPLAGTAAKLTLFENLLVADHQAQLEGTPKRQLTEKYEQLLSLVGLADRMNQLVQYLSGGERQLIALLIAKLRPSRLLLLDEPLAALDPTRSKICIDLIAQLHNDGRTIIQITHDQTLASSIGERTLILSHGTLARDEQGTSRRRQHLDEHWHVQS